MSNKVTYGDIVDALSRKTGLSKQKSEAFAKALTARIIDELQETGKASITNFGSFTVKDVAERQGQNPQTGEPITIPAHKRVNFSPYKALKEEVNAKYAHLEPELLGETDTESEAASTFKKEEKEHEQESESTAQVFGVNESSEDAEEVTPMEFEDVSEPESGEVRAEPILPKAEKEKKKLSGLSILLAILIPLIIIAGIAWFLMQPDSTSRLADQKETTRSEVPKATQQPTEEPQDLEPPATASETKPPTEASANQSVQTGNENKKAQSASAEEVSSRSYEVQQNEWHWRIARNVYGNAQFWPLIYQANFTVNDHPDTLEKSTGLIIPELEGTASKPAQSDYRRLASAFNMVAEAYQIAGLSEKSADYSKIARKWERMVD